MTLVVAIGGVRSGKSAWAEHQASELAGGAPVTVLATADPADPSMGDRIGRHVSRRPSGWPVVELHGQDEPAGSLPTAGVALLDGLGGWVAGLLERAGAFADDRDAARAATQRASAQAHAAIQSLIDASAAPNRALVVATEETGLGVVPLGAGTAAWVDLVGELNQRLVKAADLAVVVVAGRALPLTDAARPLTRPGAGPALSVVATAAGLSEVLMPEDGERRAHPRLLGAGATVRSIREAAGQLAEPKPSGIPTRPALPGGPTGGPTADTSIASLRSHGDRLVRPGDADHAVNVVAGGPPAWLTDAFAAALGSGLTHYPDASTAQSALAELYGRPAEEVVVTNGAAEALWLLPAALRPRLAACLYPLFTEAEAALHALGVPVIRVLRDPARDFAIDAASVPDDADLVLVGNPSAGSGTLVARDAIRALRRPGRTIVVDEAFMDLVPGERESLARERAADVIVVRSFTKSLSIPGVRAGCALAAPELAARLRAVQAPWSVNAFAVAGLVALGSHADELTTRAQQASEERSDLTARLQALPGLVLWPSDTNHVLVYLDGGARLAAALRERQIVVRPCGSFPGLTDDHLRITARDPDANARLVAAITEILGGTEPAA